MINNRQQGGRRRGRGGQRPQNPSGRPDGNRQDNRQRGNAAQLLEKYKSMARDAQLGGDRVQTEYYLQFADHYYRVLGESRARFDEQRRSRGEDVDDEGDDDQLEGGDDPRSQDDGGDDDRPQHDERPERNERPERDERFDRERPQPRESRERAERPERPEPTERNPRRPRYARDERNGEDVADRTSGNAPSAANPESIAFDALPPAIGRDVPAVEADAEGEAPRPKRRAPRKPRPDDTDVAPAA